MNAPLLTFDDGPSESTVEVLDLLAAHGVRATFFVTGIRATQRPDLVARAVAEGHEIGNHTWDHVRLTKYDDAGVVWRLRRTSEAIQAILGKPPRLFRGPWLDVDDRVLGLAAGLGLSHLGADVDTHDYSDLPEHSAEFVADAICAASGGQVVLLHDGIGDDMSGEVNSPRPKTVEALRLALPECAGGWLT